MTWMATLSWLASGSNLAPANPLHSALRTPTVPRGEPSCFPWPEESSPSGLVPSPASLLPMYTPAPGTLGHLQYLTPAWHHPWFTAPMPHHTPAWQTPHYLQVLAGMWLPLHVTVLSALAGFMLLYVSSVLYGHLLQTFTVFTSTACPSHPSCHGLRTSGGPGM